MEQYQRLWASETAYFQRKKTVNDLSSMNAHIFQMPKRMTSHQKIRKYLNKQEIREKMNISFNYVIIMIIIIISWGGKRKKHVPINEIEFSNWIVNRELTEGVGLELLAAIS